MSEDAFEWKDLAKQVSEFLGVEVDTISPRTHVYDELGLDSLGMFSLGMHLIKVFRIALPLHEVANISTLGDILDAFRRHAGNTPG